MSDQGKRQPRGSSAEPARAAQPAKDAPSRGQDRGQKRAAYAWNCVSEVEKAGSKIGDRYGTLARKLPGRLQVSGLGQTLAFLFARAKGAGGSAEGLLLKHLGEHLKREFNRRADETPMETVLMLSPAQYRHGTRELMALAEWLKRFAEGKLGQEDN